MHLEDIRTDPASGHIVRVERCPHDIASEEVGETLMGISWHTEELWCETPGQAHSGEDHFQSNGTNLPCNGHM